MALPVLWLCVVLPQADGFSAKKPSALMALEQARLAIRKADVNWNRSDFFSEFSCGEKKYKRSIISGREIAFFELGTADGTTAWTENGEPVSAPRAELLKEDSWWRFDRTDLYAFLWEGKGNIRMMVIDDLRTAGLLPIPFTATTVQEALWLHPKQSQSPRRYRQRLVEGIYEVEMLMSDTDTVYKWYIDPELGWNPLRCEGIYQGRVFAESICEYDQHGDVWFPVSAAYLNSVGDLVTLIEVESVTVNSADIPDELTPDILGMGNGMPVLPQRGGRRVPPGSGNLLYGTGGSLFTIKQYSQLKKKGLIETSPILIEWQRRVKEHTRAMNRRAKETPGGADAVEPQQPKAWRLSSPLIVRNKVDVEWDKYTADFIKRYKLDEGQRQVAGRILRDCKEQRTRYLRSRRAQIAKLEGRLSGQKLAKDRHELLIELERINSPIHEIFEEQLKPRLDKLLTRKQRKAVESEKTGKKNKDGE